MFKSLILSIAYIILITNARMNTRYEDIKDALSRMAHYELIHFDLSSFESNNIIGFNAFNQHYKLKLRVNHDIIMGQVRHYAGTPYNPRHLNTSCHYHGSIINIDEHSSAALSMCPGRGIVGYIRFHNDRFEFNPSSHWFDGKISPNKDNEITDQHLIYKISDYNTTGIPIKTYGKRSLSKFTRTIPYIGTNNIIKTQQRRLLASTKTVELYILSDPSFTKYSSNAEDDAGDICNKLTEYYSRGSWSIGSIRFKLSGFDAASSWSGKYSKAEFVSNADRWADKFESYTDSIGFPGDAAHLITKERLSVEGGSLAGLASFAVMCRSKSRTTGISRASGSGTSDISETMAHEIGHHFAMEHDEDEGCGSRYIMAASSGNNPSDWSRCSETAVEKHCSRNSNCNCLDGGGSNNNNNNNYDDDDNNNNGGGDCLIVSGMRPTYNGAWSQQGDNKWSMESYYYLFRSDGYWTISKSSSSADWERGWCEETDIERCNGRWESYDDEYTRSRFERGSCNGFTHKEEPSCLQEDEFEEEICIYNMESDGSTKHEFILSHDKCMNDRPIYYHNVYNKSYSYYLEWGTASRNGSWVISKYYNGDDYGTATAWCDGDELNANECGKGEWDVRMFTGDTIRIVSDETMFVMNSACDSGGITEKGMKTAGIWMWFTIISIVALFIVLGVGLLIFVKAKNKSMKAPKMISIELDDDDNEEEIEVEYEMEDINQTTAH